MKLEGGGARPLKCEPCDRVFSHLWLMELHNEQYHAVEKRVPCAMGGCRRTFSRRAAMQSHVAVDHLGDPYSACEYCGYAYELSYDLRTHEARCCQRSAEGRRQYLREHMSYDPVLTLPPAKPQAPTISAPAKKRPAPAPQPPVVALNGGGVMAGAGEEAEILASALTQVSAGGVSSSGAVEDVAVDRAGGTSPVIVTVFDMDIRADDLYRLEGSGWLNHVIINATMLLLNAEIAQRPSAKGKIYCGLIDFFAGIKGRELQRNPDRRHLLRLRTYDWLFFPVHTMSGMHWALVVVNVPARTIEYADSLGRDGTTEMRVMESFLIRDEAREAEGGAQPSLPWRLVNRYQTVPQQPNSNDCGVFICETARHWMRHVLSNDTSPRQFAFSARDIPRIRRRMQIDLIRAGLAHTKERLAKRLKDSQQQEEEEAPPTTPDSPIEVTVDPFAFMHS